MKKQLQKAVEKLANDTLKDSGVFNNYSDRDLLNSTLIFSYFLMDAIYTQNQKLSKTKQIKLVTTVGKAIRELVLASTGKDMHVIAKQK